MGVSVDKIIQPLDKENKPSDATGSKTNPAAPKRSAEDKALDKKYRQAVRESMEKVIMKLVEHFIEFDDGEKVVIDENTYSKEDIRNLMFNMLEPKIQKLLECILKHHIQEFMGFLNISEGDELEKNAVDFFEWMLLDSEMLRQQFHQGKITAESPEVEHFCKGLLGFDMIASEVVRLASVFGLNQKFKSAECGTKSGSCVMQQQCNDSRRCRRQINMEE